MAVRETDLLCHDLLLRLAGRLPDRHLWRFRDWLTGDAVDVVARTLPSALVRERVELDDADPRQLREALLPLGADPAVVDAILPGNRPDPLDCTFTPESPTGRESDSEVLVLGATLRGRPGVGEVHSTWRSGPDGAVKRVVLVQASTGVVDLTGEIQRILRALGDPEPCVEVLGPEAESHPYHRAALRASVLVCSGADDLVGTRG